MLHKIVYYSARILAETLPKMSSPHLRPSDKNLKDLEESLVLLIFNAPFFDVRSVTCPLIVDFGVFGCMSG